MNHFAEAGGLSLSFLQIFTAFAEKKNHQFQLLLWKMKDSPRFATHSYAVILSSSIIECSKLGNIVSLT